MLLRVNSTCRGHRHPMSSRGNFFDINSTSKGKHFSWSCFLHQRHLYSATSLPSASPLPDPIWDVQSFSEEEEGVATAPPPCWATGWMEDGKVERGFILLLWLRFKTHVNVSLLFTSLGYSVLSCLSTFQKKPSFITPNSKEILPPFPPVTSYISVHAPNWSFYNSNKRGNSLSDRPHEM